MLAAVCVLLLLRGTDGGDEVALPPVQQTELRLAARTAGCDLRTGRARRGEELPVDGPSARPARAGFYEDDQPPAALVGALRRGVVVISYRAELPDRVRDDLRELQTAVPRGTIVTTNRRMPFAIAISAWRRRLACPRVEPATLDAVRLFRGRFLGSGPDSPP